MKMVAEGVQGLGRDVGELVKMVHGLRASIDSIREETKAKA